MKTISASGVAALILVLVATTAQAQSCADLWYARNLIYAQNGFCFKTSLGRRVFAGYDCWTNNPRFSRAERRRVEAIRREERRRGCKVNN